mgnify:CR=1 FL=1
MLFRSPALTAQAESGDAEAQLQLGLRHFDGDGVAQDFVKAVKWLRKAAEQDHAEAQFNLGICYFNGRGVPKDETEAVKWDRKAAGQGYAEAQDNLGVGYATGQGVPKDEAEAVKWFRKAAEQNLALAQYNLGVCHAMGEGVPKDEVEAVKWFRKAAEQGEAVAQINLGRCYANGRGVPKDETEAVKWFRKAAEPNFAEGQFALGISYEKGLGVPKDEAEAVRWYRKAAEQNFALAQFELGSRYVFGKGVLKDNVSAHFWLNLAGAQGKEFAREFRQRVEDLMTPEQVAQATALARNWQPGTPLGLGAPAAHGPSYASSGTGFFISEDGYLVTCEHVLGGASRARVVTAGGTFDARVIKTDPANDLALLKVEGTFSALPVAASRGVRLGGTAATVGFPNTGLQGFSPKLARGEVAGLTGSRDDARYFQISAPIQPGNSGGALVDERGNVIGVVAAKLSHRAALAATGALPENVNYAVKSS